MKAHRTVIPAVIIAVLATTPVAVPQTFTEFLKNGLTSSTEEEKEKTKSFADDEASSGKLEDSVRQSAAQKGIATAPGQYKRYAKKLSKTLSMLSGVKQQRIFH